MNFRNAFYKCLTVALAFAVLVALTKPASAQMTVYSGRIIAMSGNTVTLLDANGNQEMFYVGDATSGLVNLQVGNTVTVSLFPTSTVVSNVSLVRNAEFDPAVNPTFTTVHYYRSSYPSSIYSYPSSTPVYYYPSSTVYPAPTYYPVTYPYREPLIRIRF